MTKTLAAVLLGTTLLSSAAMAQSATAPAATGASSAAVAPAPALAANQWRASKLMGVKVYNQANENIGSVQELITGPDGRIATVVIGVGGFLGMGEHNVGVAFDQVKWTNDTVASSTSATAPSAGSTTGSAARPAGTSNNNNPYPDHGILNATKDQLKAMPAFKY